MRRNTNSLYTLETAPWRYFAVGSFSCGSFLLGHSFVVLYMLLLLIYFISCIYLQVNSIISEKTEMIIENLSLDNDEFSELNLSTNILLSILFVYSCLGGNDETLRLFTSSFKLTSKVVNLFCVDNQNNVLDIEEKPSIPKNSFYTHELLTLIFKGSIFLVDIYEKLQVAQNTLTPQNRIKLFETKEALKVIFHEAGYRPNKKDYEQLSFKSAGSYNVQKHYITSVQLVYLDLSKYLKSGLGDPLARLCAEALMVFLELFLTSRTDPTKLEHFFQITSEKNVKNIESCQILGQLFESQQQRRQNTFGFTPLIMATGAIVLVVVAIITTFWE